MKDPGFTTTELTDYRVTRHIVVSSHVREQLLERRQHPDQEAQSTEAPNDKQPHSRDLLEKE